jgi:hypothetical protein
VWRHTLLVANPVRGATNEEGRICYMLSEADDHVDIVEHAEPACANGWDVLIYLAEVAFENTPHCNHTSSDVIRYLEIMQR